MLGKLSVELARDAADRDDVLGVSPGLRGSVLGPNWIDLRGVVGENGRLGGAEGADWLEWPEKRCMRCHLYFRPDQRLAGWFSVHRPRIIVVLGMRM